MKIGLEIFIIIALVVAISYGFYQLSQYNAMNNKDKLLLLVCKNAHFHAVNTTAIGTIVSLIIDGITPPEIVVFLDQFPVPGWKEYRFLFVRNFC